MCLWGNLITEKDQNLGIVPQLCMFSLESIYGPCTAIPYKTTSNQINATEWVIIQDSSKERMV